MTLSGNNLVSLVLAAVWPRFCVECGAEGALLCRNCSLTWAHEPPAPESGHIAFYAYANPIVRKLICAWKYDYDQSALAILLSEVRELLPEFKSGLQALGIQAIVPLPLSPRRLRERGFNQSRLLADWLASELGLPVIDVLERTDRRGHQAERTDEERHLAMSDSPFRLSLDKSLPAVVLLVDDVWTTGATMQAARQVLEVTGKTKVFGFTLAKG